MEKSQPEAIVAQQAQNQQDSLSQAIQAFWKQVQTSEQSFNALELVDIMENLNKLLSENQLEVTAVITSGHKKNHKIIFTAQGNIDRFEQVIEIVKHTPNLEFFETEAFRQRAQNMGELTMQLDGNAFSLGAADLLIQYNEDHRKIALGISFGKTIPEGLMEHAQTMAFIILDHILGEYDFAVKVGPVEFLEAAQDAATTPLNQFTPIFDNLWKENLKHTGVFPRSDAEDEVVVFELTSRNDPNDKLLVQRNEAANTLVGHANYCMPSQ